MMCHKAICRKCGKQTWAGCGRHIQSIMASIPPDQRCQCSTVMQTAGRPPPIVKPVHKPFGSRR